MPWGRIDDSLYDHPKLDALGRNRLPCVGLNTLAQSWCNRWLTDGYVPHDRVRKLGGTPALAEALVVAGMWERADGGYQIHDFLDYNDSRESVLAQREAARERMRNKRRSSGDVRPNVTGSSGDVQEPRARVSRPVPSRPDPVPSVPAGAHVPDDEDGYETVVQWLAARKAWLDSPKVQTDLARLVDRKGAEAVIQAMLAAEAEDSAEVATQYVYGARNRLLPLPGSKVQPSLTKAEAASLEAKRQLGLIS